MASIFKVGLIGFLLAVIPTVANAEPVFATDYRAKAIECLQEQRTIATQGNRDAILAVNACGGRCRSAQAPDASAERIQACKVAYEEYRAIMGYSLPAETAAYSEAFQVDTLTAHFSVRNGRVNQFQLIPAEQDAGASLVKDKCFITLTPEQIQSITLYNNPQLRAKTQQIRQNNQILVFRLTDITWTEDGTRRQYECNVGHIDIEGLERG